MEAVFSSNFWKALRQDPSGPGRFRAGPAGFCRKKFNFIKNIETGSIPSVEKVQLLAAYLGVSTSDLLGEKTSFLHEGPDQLFLVTRFNALSKDDQEEILTLVEMKYHKALREITEAAEKSDK